MSGRPQNVFLEKMLFGVYHLVVAVGSLFLLNYYSLRQPNVTSAFERMIKGESNDEALLRQQVSNKSVITEMSGNVRVFEDEFSGSERAAVNGDVLKTGFTVETKDDASVILDLKNGNRIHLLPQTVVKIDELEGQAEGKTLTLMTLSKGAIFTTTKLGVDRVIDVKAGLSRYSLQTSTSAIVSDGNRFNLLVVKSGSVRAENSHSLQFDMIPAKHSYYVNNEGQERKSGKLEIISLFDWKHEALKTEFDEEVILASTGGPFVVTEEKKLSDEGLTSQMLAELEAKVTEELKRYKEESSEIHSALMSERESLTNLLKSQEKEAVKIYADINCLETSRQCDLYSEKLLLSRGYVRIHQSARMAASIIKDLKKYLDEQTTIKVEKQKVVNDLAKLELRRSETLIWVESRLADKTLLKPILTKLTDPTLSR